MREARSPRLGVFLPALCVFTVFCIDSTVANTIYGIRVDAPAYWLVADLAHDGVCRADETLELQPTDASRHFAVNGDGRTLNVASNASLDALWRRLSAGSDGERRFRLELVASRPPTYRRVVAIDAELLPRRTPKFRSDDYVATLNVSSRTTFRAGTSLDFGDGSAELALNNAAGQRVAYEFASAESWARGGESDAPLLQLNSARDQRGQLLVRVVLAQDLLSTRSGTSVTVFVGAFDGRQPRRRIAMTRVTVRIVGGANSDESVGNRTVGPPPVFPKSSYRIVASEVIPHRTIVRIAAKAWKGMSTYRVEPESAPFDIAPLFGDVFARRGLPAGRYVFDVVALDRSAQESRVHVEVTIRVAASPPRARNTTTNGATERQRLTSALSSRPADKDRPGGGRQIRRALTRRQRGDDLLIILPESQPLGLLKQTVPLRNSERVTKAARADFAAASRHIFLAHSNGSLELTRPLNYEAENLLQLALRVDSAESSRMQTIRVEVTDVAEPPRFLNSPRPFLAVVPFQPAVGHRVYQLQARAEGGDAPDGSVRYRLINTDPLDAFTVDEKTGAVRTALRRYTAGETYRVFVHAVDVTPRPRPDVEEKTASGPAGEIAVVEVYAGERPPQFARQKYVVAVPEDTPIDKPVLELETVSFPTASGGSGRRKGPITYSLRSNTPTISRSKSGGKKFDAKLAAGDKNDVNNEKNGDGGVLDYFRVGERDGVLRLRRILDYDDPALAKSFLLYVVATEEGRRSEVPVEIHVRDVNDNSPAFAQPLYAATVRENVPVGRTILQVRAVDRDSGANGAVRYSVDHPDFMVNDRGEIAAARRLDADQRREGFFIYRFNVSAHDDGRPLALSTSALVHIRTENVNDETPEFIDASAVHPSDAGETAELRTSVAEDAQAGTPVLQLQALDADRDQVAYSFFDPTTGEESTEAANGVFRLDRDTGLIRLQSPLHVPGGEPPPRHYNLTVVAMDDGSCCRETAGADEGTHRRVARVRVAVADVNNNKPEFRQCAEYGAMARLEEGQYRTQGPVILKAHAIDEDSGLNGDVRYSIYYGRAEKRKPFVIDAETGELRPSPYFVFDREQKSLEEVTIKATDRGDRPLIGFCQFSVQILDVNDNAPQFDRPLYETSLARGVGAGAAVLSVQASDADAPTNARISYALAADETAPADRRADHKLFRLIDSASGEIVLAKRLPAGVDRLTFAVVASDNGRPEARTAAVPVVVKVHDRAQNAPQWQGGVDCRETIYVDEDIQINTVLLKCFAVVNDDKRTPISYKLSNGGGSERHADGRPLFREFVEKAPDAGSDLIVVRNMESLDYESARNHTLTLTATDMISLATSEKHFYVTVRDRNDEVPRFTVDQFVGAVDEELEPAAYMDKYNGTPITVVRAVDADAPGPQSDVRYRILDDGGGASNFFRIDELSGAVFPLARFDRERQDSFIFDVEASDSMPSSLPYTDGPNKDLVKVQIFVTDLNDNPPYFPHPFYNETVAEDIEISRDVLTVRAEDLDSQSVLRYSLYAADGVSRVPFGVRTETGVVFVTEPLDHEHRDAYELVVAASDGRHNVSTPVRINVRDVNDNAPRFDRPLYQATVDETPAGATDLKSESHVLLRLHADDLDKNETNGRIVYALEGDGIDRHFRVGRHSGVVELVGAGLDRDPPSGRAVWKFIAQAIDADGQGLVGYADVHVHVRDVNDNAPVFPSEIHASLAENSSPDAFVTQVRATDADDPTTPNAELEYSIRLNKELDGSPVFRIEPHTGKIFSTVRLDREKSAQREFHIQVRASDKGTPPLEGVGNVTIRVLDVNDNPPYFEREEYEITVPETTERYAPILTLAARDPDNEAVDNVFTYELTEGPEELFYVTTEEDSRGSRIGVLRLNQPPAELTRTLLKAKKSLPRNALTN